MKLQIEIQPVEEEPQPSKGLQSLRFGPPCPYCRIVKTMTKDEKGKEFAPGYGIEENQNFGNRDFSLENCENSQLKNWARS